MQKLIRTSNPKLFTIDLEMQNAIDELGKAQVMLDNAANQYRIDEAIHRLNAAHCRIEAIKHERRNVS